MRGYLEDQDAGTPGVQITGHRLVNALTARNTCEQIRTVSFERVDPKVLAEFTTEQMAEVEEAIRHELGFSAGTDTL
jgi:hypothetical protein